MGAPRCESRLLAGTIGGLVTLKQRERGMTGGVDFERLVDAHYAGLYRFALSLTHRESEACDLTQETFLVWAAKGHQLQDPSKVKSWLFTTLHRQFLEWQRRQKRFPHHELETVEFDLPKVPPGTADALDATTALHLLSRLDQTFRAPVALFYLEDYSYNEIAAILTIPLGTVKSRISRGLAQLQRLLVQPTARTLPSRQPSYE